MDRALSNSGRVLLTPGDNGPDEHAAFSMAAEFSETHATRFGAVLHLHADTAVQMTTEMAKIAYGLVADAGPLDAAQAVRALRAWLATRQDWLLVAYGVRDENVLDSLCDLPGGRIVVACGAGTATLRDDVAVVRVGPFDAEAVPDSHSELPPDDMVAAVRVAELVEFCPVGQAVAEALVHRSGRTWSNLANALASVSVTCLDSPTGTDRVLALALDGLARLRPTETKLLCALSSFTPSIVPVAAIERAHAALGSTMVADGRRVAEVVEELASWNLVGLVTRGDGTELGVRVHSPVRRLMWRSLPAESRTRWHRRTVAFSLRTVLDRHIDDLDVLPLGVCASRRTLATGIANETPIPAVAAALRSAGFRRAADELLEDPRATSALLGDVAAGLARDRIEAEALLDGDQPSHAIRVCDRALQRADEVRSSETERDPAVEREVELLRLVCSGASRKHGRLAEAAVALDPLLDEYDTDPGIRVLALVELAEIEACRGRWDESRSALLQAVEVAGGAGVDDERIRLAAETALCRELLQQRSLDEANSRLNRLLAEFGSCRVGAGPFTTLLRLQGEVLTRRGDLVAAEQSFRRALVIDELAGESTRGAAAIDRAGVAFVLQRHGRHAAAVAEFHRALQDRVAYEAVDAEVVPVLLARYCLSLVEVGDMDQALDFSRRAVRLRSRRLLPSNLDLAEILESRGKVLIAANRPNEAGPLLSRAVDVVEGYAANDETLELQETILRRLGRDSDADELRRKIGDVEATSRRAAHTDPRAPSGPERSKV